MRWRTLPEVTSSTKDHPVGAVTAEVPGLTVIWAINRSAKTILAGVVIDKEETSLAETGETEDEIQLICAQAARKGQKQSSSNNRDRPRFFISLTANPHE